jgi:hypothetical protein
MEVGADAWLVAGVTVEAARAPEMQQRMCARSSCDGGGGSCY